jgi:hypothetical protein
MQQIKTMFRVLPLLLCMSAGLIVANPANAALIGPSIELFDANPTGLGPGFDVYRVYGNFNHPADNLIAVDVGTFGIVSGGGNFYQDANGSDVPPNALLFPTFPALEWDSFVTIGATSFQNGGGNVVVLPPQPAFQPGSIPAGVAWVQLTPTSQGMPDPLGRVLILQLTVPDGGAGPSGLITIFYLDGVTGNTNTLGDQFFAVPAPGALAMLALGLLNLRGRGGRRRG